MTDTQSDETLSAERSDLLEALAAHRYFLRYTVEGLTDEQARQRTTVSELTLGGLIKHVAETESGWLDFIADGASSMGAGTDWAEGGDPDPAVIEAYASQFILLPDESLADVLARYDEVTARTDELVRTVDLDLSHPLPEAPWFPPGATRSARRVFLHIIAETSQHAGHADIIREGIDGQKTMG